MQLYTFDINIYLEKSSIIYKAQLIYTLEYFLIFFISKVFKIYINLKKIVVKLGYLAPKVGYLAREKVDNKISTLVGLNKLYILNR